MRPNRLTICGFTAFREEITVDFSGADLFALTGPTGSGKSSLIDAMVFALYGSVPRIGQRDVAPIVSLGKLEARVLFEFSLDGDDYTIARVVRRTNSGATTAEARLERAGEVLAGTADEVTDAVENLLGLGFDHFTKSVVLPQGRFAAFLHDRPADRQKLLRELLDLGVYARMRELATQRKTAAEERVRVLATQLEELAFATEDGAEQASGRLESLRSLRKEVEVREPDMARLREEIKASRESEKRAGASVARLQTVTKPDGIDELAARRTDARRLVDQATEEAEESGEALKQSGSAREALPDRSTIDRVVALHHDLAEERKTLDGLIAGLEKARAEKTASGTVLSAVMEELAVARRRLETTRQTHAAHALATTLVRGEECPVCHQTVTELPSSAPLPALREAEAALQTKAEAEEAARRVEGVAARQLATQEALLADSTSRLEKMESDLTAAPTLEEALRTQKEIAAADADVQEARRVADAKAGALASARKQAEGVEKEITKARRFFDEVRDNVAALEPPSPGRDDLAEDWRRLERWAKETIERLTGEATAAQQAVADLERRLDENLAALSALLEHAGLDPGDRPVRDVVVTAVTVAEHDLGRLREALQRAGELRLAIDAAGSEAELAKTLSRHLSATGFEAWLMEEALAALVVGANQLLDDLAGGAYSLDVVRRDFRVVDHRNADEPRLVKTLSGGETFLVSLALALSLAEQLASLSVHGGSRLESVFLDEGFGTLDIETLDTVAHVIQELGARGRTVGIVTHVRELAEQVPVRFEVRKGAGSATVERVEL